MTITTTLAAAQNSSDAHTRTIRAATRVRGTSSFDCARRAIADDLVTRQHIMRARKACKQATGWQEREHTGHTLDTLMALRAVHALEALTYAEDLHQAVTEMHGGTPAATTAADTVRDWVLGRLRDSLVCDTPVGIVVDETLGWADQARELIGAYSTRASQ